MALVVFLRGVNVGGHRTFRPSVLAAQLRHLDVVNIGAAGTFVIRKPVSQARVRAELARRLPFDTTIAICNGREVLQLLSREPFANHPVRPGVVRFVSVLCKRTHSASKTPLSLPPKGRWMVKVLARENRFIIGMYRREMKVLRFLDNLDDLFGAPVTTRNWNTLVAIARVLDTREQP